MSVDLDPTELGFQRPLTQELTQTLRLRNGNAIPVAFKVKTTAPKQYCVRPNSGRIEPGQEVEVQVLLQALKEDPPLDAKCKDKFLVQSVGITAENADNHNISAIWSHIEHTARSTIQEKKIRVVYLPAAGSIATPAAKSINGVNHTDSTSATNSPAYGDSAPPVYRDSAVHQPPRPERASSVGLLRAEERTGSARDSELPSTMEAVKAAVTNVIPTSGEELKEQLAEARATIARLTNQLDQGLRQRKSGPGGQDKDSFALETTTGGGLQNTPKGVPVYLVAVLCLLSFLLAYFLF